MTTEQPQPTDFEKRRAFQRFNELVTPETVAQIHEEVCVFQQQSTGFEQLLDLIDTFRHPTIDPDLLERGEVEAVQFFIGGLRRRDAEFMKMAGAEIYEPNSQATNQEFIHKIREVATGKAPRAFHAV